jgi:hypothetical protein
MIKGREIDDPLVWRVGYPQDDFVAQQIAPVRSVAGGAQDGSVGHPEVVSPYEGINVEARDPILERGYCVPGYSDPERRTENLHGLFKVPFQNGVHLVPNALYRLDNTAEPAAPNIAGKKPRKRRPAFTGDFTQEAVCVLRNPMSTLARAARTIPANVFIQGVS